MQPEDKVLHLLYTFFTLAPYHGWMVTLDGVTIQQTSKGYTVTGVNVTNPSTHPHHAPEDAIAQFLSLRRGGNNDSPNEHT